MGDLHLVHPALNLSVLDAGIFIMVQQVRLMIDGRSSPEPGRPRPRTQILNQKRKKCRNAFTCDFVQEDKEVRSMQTSAKAIINATVNCRTSRVIYLVFEFIEGLGFWD